MPGWINFAVDGGNGNGWIEELERGRYSVAGEDKGCLRQFGYCGCEFVRLLGYRYRVVAVEGDVVEGGPGKSCLFASSNITGGNSLNLVDEFLRQRSAAELAHFSKRVQAHLVQRLHFSKSQTAVSQNHVLKCKRSFFATTFLDYYTLRDSLIRGLAKTRTAQDTMIILATAKSWRADDGSREHRCPLCFRKLAKAAGILDLNQFWASFGEEPLFRLDRLSPNSRLEGWLGPTGFPGRVRVLSLTILQPPRRVKVVFESPEVDLRKRYAVHEETVYGELIAMIGEIPKVEGKSTLKRDVFKSFLDKIYKRSK
ncbi:hypothetical protein ARMGADRAFT_1038664 [Armillaria gallica]|uniref:Uncharacterized protein n=1 Tax=Armillaria gallica TaxID=47427 RepID=A0A2H3D4B9_ARMGA|nr:hypothetical protein ARMGADRAFT_1038664 [Armillaria gallica]